MSRARAHSGEVDSARAANSVFTLPLVGRVGALSAFTRVFDALWRRGWGSCGDPLTDPPPPPPPPRGGGGHPGRDGVLHPEPKKNGHRPAGGPPTRKFEAT